MGKQVEVRSIELDTVDIDFIKLWLKEIETTALTKKYPQVQNIMFDIVLKWESAEIKEIL